MLNFKPNILTPAKNVSADILIPRLVFILSVVFLVLFGLIMVFSASNVEALSQNSNPYNYVIKQFIFCIVGVFFAFLIWRAIPYTVWTSEKVLWCFFSGLMILMFATLFMGKDILGARRWIYIGGVSFQPSEFAKIMLVLIVAKYYAEYKNKHISKWQCTIFISGLSALMLGFVLAGQSDLGTTVICVIGILALLWIAGLPIYIFGIILGITFFGGVIAIVTSGWRSNRFAFLDPYNDGANGYGAGYQLIRSFYALAEGGLAGVGLGNSYEKFQYLPEAETDFIFSIVGDELGFLGCMLVLTVFALFVVSGMFIALRSKNRFAASVSGSFVIMLGFQAALNILCVIGFAPTTGKPLPFISSGGSSLIASLVMVGFVLAGSEADALPDEYQRARSKFKVESGNKNNEEPSDKISAFKSSIKIPTIITKKPTSKTPNRTRVKQSSSKQISKNQSRKSTGLKNTSGTTYKRKSSNLGFKPQKLELKIVEKPSLKTSSRSAKRKNSLPNSSNRSTNKLRTSYSSRKSATSTSQRTRPSAKTSTPRTRMNNKSNINTVKLRKRK